MPGRNFVPLFGVTLFILTVYSLFSWRSSSPSGTILGTTLLATQSKPTVVHSNSNTSSENAPDYLDFQEEIIYPYEAGEYPALFHSIPGPTVLFRRIAPNIRHLLSQPIDTYSQSYKIQENLCASNSKQANQEQMEKETPFWSSLTEHQGRAERENVVEKLEERLGLGLRSHAQNEGLETSMDRSTWNALFGKGRGIVFTAKSKDSYTRLLTTLRILRLHHKTTLPIEIFGFREDFENLPSDIRAGIKELNDPDFPTVLKKMKQYPSRNMGLNIIDDGITREWGSIVFRQVQTDRTKSWKAEAIVESSFSEVLYLDPDNIPLRDPTFLFDSTLYKQTGVAFWSDLYKDSTNNAIYRLLNFDCVRHEWQISSGQILVSKTAENGVNLVAFMIARIMQERSEFWGHFSRGNKDTFRYAYHFLSENFMMAPHWVSLAGSIIPAHKGHQFCGHSLVQYGFSTLEWKPLLRKGKVDSGWIPPRDHAPPLFLHANLLKFSGSFNEPYMTWETLKSASPDVLRHPSSTLMTRDIRGRIYQHRGYCADLWDSTGPAREGRPEDIGLGYGAPYDHGRFGMWDFQEGYGGIMRDIESIYYGLGGISGGRIGRSTSRSVQLK